MCCSYVLRENIFCVACCVPMSGCGLGPTAGAALHDLGAARRNKGVKLCAIPGVGILLRGAAAALPANPGIGEWIMNYRRHRRGSSQEGQ
jgi:hypothetical protein